MGKIILNITENSKALPETEAEKDIKYLNSYLSLDNFIKSSIMHHKKKSSTKYKDHIIIELPNIVNVFFEWEIIYQCSSFIEATEFIDKMEGDK